MINSLFAWLRGRSRRGQVLHSNEPPTPLTASNLADISGEPIVRTRLAHSTYDSIDYRNRSFNDLNANQATFVSCDFSYSIFHRAYFHGATFESCKFTGCRFYDGNLRGASFYRCDVRYATFHRTLIEPKELLATLPLEPNLRRASLQNLRANAVEIGDFRSQRTYVLEEVKAKADHLSRAVRGSDSYYRRKFPTLADRAKAGLALLALRFGGFVWGHGERPIRILASASLLLFLLTLINFWGVLPRVGWEESRSGLAILRYSIDVLLDVQPQERFRGFPLIDYGLIIMRYVYIGLFVSVLFKSISHR